MPRVLLPVAAMILTAMAIALLAGSILLPSFDPAARLAANGPAVVERFYAAVNTTITTGDTAELRRVAAPHFVAERPQPGAGPGHDGLVAYLLALHEAGASERLVAEIVAAEADQVVTRVEVRGGDRAFVRPLAKARLDFTTPIPQVVTLARIGLEPEASWDAARAELRLLVVEDGTLVVESTRASRATAVPDPGPDRIGRERRGPASPDRVMLPAARSWTPPSDGHTSVTNVGGRVARLLVVIFAVPQIPNGSASLAPRVQSGVEMQVLAGGLASRIGTREVAVTLKRLTLASGAHLSLSSAEGPLLIGLTTGTLKARALGTQWVRHRRDGRSTATEEAVVAAGDGVLLLQGGVVALEPDGGRPLQFVLLTLHSPLQDP